MPYISVHTSSFTALHWSGGWHGGNVSVSGDGSEIMPSTIMTFFDLDCRLTSNSKKVVLRNGKNAGLYLNKYVSRGTSRAAV